MKRKYCLLCLVVVASTLAALPPRGVQAQELPPLTPEEAILAAQGFIDSRVARGVFTQWTGIVAEPLLYYDLNMQPSVYVLSLKRENEVIGYLTVDYWPRAYPVLEFAPSLPPHLRQGMVVQSLIQRKDVAVDLQHPVYLGPLSYYLRLIPATRETEPLWLDLRIGQEFTPTRASTLDLQFLSQRAVAPPIVSMALAPSASKILGGITDYNQFWGTDYGYGFSCYSGCTNHGALSALSFWNTHGYPNLISGNWRDDIDWLRSSAGGGCSGSWTYTDIGTIGPAVEAFTQHKGYNYFSAPLWYPSQSTYAAYCAEIDANRPVVLHLINPQAGFYGGNHTVAGIGYDTDGSYMIVYDNLSTQGDQVWIQYQVRYGETWMNQIMPDNIAPSTTHASSGVLGKNGWYVSSVQVTLSANDNSGGSGVKLTQYKIDNGAWQTYSAPFTISGDGRHTIYYKSQDNAGNWEGEKRVIVPIDAAAPTGALTLNDGATIAYSALVQASLSASDATSGLYQMRLRDAGGTWGDWQPYAAHVLWQLPAVTDRSYTVEVQFKDWAGNTSSYSCSIYLNIYPARPSSSNYRLARSTLGAASWDRQSTNYQLQGTLGQPSMIGQLSSANYHLSSGYWAAQSGIYAVYLPLIVRNS